MGQKQNPNALRQGITKRSSSAWYASTAQYTKYVQQDFALRTYMQKHYANAGIHDIVIERPAGSIQVKVHCSRPGILIGKKGSDVDKIRHELSAIIGVPVHVAVQEVKKVDLSAKLVAESITGQLERRIQFRKAMKRAVQNTMRAGAKGIKVSCSGRLGGNEIARTEWLRDGSIPSHTLRADIDYAEAEALTTYGIIGIKVWIYKGEVFAKEFSQETNKVTPKEGKV